MNCKIEWLDEKTVKISGIIDEFSDFDDAVSKFPEEITLDLKDVVRINSAGVRQWLRAIKDCDSAIRYVNCSSVMVDQINLVPHVLGKNGRVESFEVIYACQDCDSHLHQYLEVGTDIHEFTDEPKLDLQKTCSNCGGIAELDHILDLYFIFLKKD